MKSPGFLPTLDMVLTVLSTYYPYIAIATPFLPCYPLPKPQFTVPSVSPGFSHHFER